MLFYFSCLLKQGGGSQNENISAYKEESVEVKGVIYSSHVFMYDGL